MEYIVFKNVNKKIGGAGILSSINLTVHEGEATALCGRNASGKTMMLRAMAGLIRPTSGYITIAGKELTRMNPYPQSMGLIIETMKFWPYYTGFDCLKIIASIKNEIKDEDIRKAIRRVGLDPDDRRLLRKYSMGMRQRLAIAQAIMESPRLLLLDEPTNSLDDEGRDLFQKIMHEEKSRGATIVVATHIVEDLGTFCDTYYKIDNGALALDKSRP
jgi:ABC-2 type transport system ATP-binding protein